MIKVSVIVPIYGTEKYIERCANSLFAQTLDSLEFIFIDDCSPDKSIEILNSIIGNNQRRFSEMNWKVRIVRMPSNSGLAAVRRHGIQLATGEYVIQCDSDDWVEAVTYELLYNKAIANNSDVCVCGYQTHNGTNTVNTYRGLSHLTNIDCINDFLLQKNSWSLCNKLYKRELFDKIEHYPKCNMGEDMALSLQLFYYCKHISFLDQPMYFYFINQESISKKAGLESCLKRFYEVMDNASIVIEFYNNKYDRMNYQNSLVYLKYFCKTKLWPVLEWDRKYYSLWDETFKGLTVPLLFSRNIPLSIKVRYCLTNLRLYPR